MNARHICWSFSAAACFIGLAVAQMTTTEISSTAMLTLTTSSVDTNCSSVNRSLCEACLPGMFSNNTSEGCFCCSDGLCVNSSDCQPCPMGHYQPLAGQQSCIPCLPGFYANSTKSAMCRACQPGYFSNETGATVCRECGKGYFASHQSSSSCEPCPSGSFCNTTTCILCAVCPAGAEAVGIASIECVPCHPGMFKGPSDQVCRICSPGDYQVKWGGTNCDRCPENHYCPSPNVYPVECPPDAFCPAGSIEPQYCMETFFRKAGDTCELAPLTIVLLGFSSLIGVLAIIVLFLKFKQRCSTMLKVRSPLLSKDGSPHKGYGTYLDAEPVYTGW